MLRIITHASRERREFASAPLECHLNPLARVLDVAVFPSGNNSTRNVRGAGLSPSPGSITSLRAASSHVMWVQVALPSRYSSDSPSSSYSVKSPSAPA